MLLYKLAGSTAPSPLQALRLSVSRKHKTGFKCGCRASVSWGHSDVTRVEAQRMFRPVHWGGRLLKEVLSSVSFNIRSAHTHSHPRVHTPACWLIWAWGISNWAAFKGLSLERKNPATPTVQDHLGLSILTGWQWRSQNQEHEPATAAHVSLSGRHLVPVQRAKPVAGVFVRSFHYQLCHHLWKLLPSIPHFHPGSKKTKSFQAQSPNSFLQKYSKSYLHSRCQWNWLLSAWFNFPEHRTQFPRRNVFILGIKKQMCIPSAATIIFRRVLYNPNSLGFTEILTCEGGGKSFLLS